MRESINCDTIVLKNKSLLYYQFNCDSVWLTLENKKGNKNILFSMGAELYGYTYRLGYQLIKEFKTTLLFRSGCAANGPCNYVLTNKENGKEIEKFGELIFNSEDSLSEFIIYFSDDKLSSLTLYFINTNKKYKIKIPAERFIGKTIIPEQQFEKPVLENDNLTLTYKYKLNKKENWVKDNINIDLKKFKK